MISEAEQVLSRWRSQKKWEDPGFCDRKKASCTGTDPEKYREIRSAEYSGNRR